MALDLPVHGGDLAAAETRWGKPAAGWLDLSTGINPWPYPVAHLPATAWTRLPGSSEEQAAKAAARHAFGCPDADVVMAGGSSALILALALSQAPTSVAVLGPTYGEHARAWALAGHRVTEIDSLPESGEVVVVVNPNNPDGRRLEPARLLALAERCRLLVVDEAFGEVTPELSVAASASDRLVVLRSFGKFYGLAGLRLGFALTGPALGRLLTDRLGPWPVSGMALAVAAKALADHAWAQVTRAHLASMADRLDAVLIDAGLNVVGGTSLFRLAAHPQAGVIYDRLGRAGILVRAFVGRPNLLRFGLPPDQAELERLGAAL
jgi:cobalamin biosynthetic protein CobC